MLLFLTALLAISEGVALSRVDDYRDSTDLHTFVTVSTPGASF